MPDLFFYHDGNGKHSITIEQEFPPDELGNDPERIYITVRSGRRIFRIWASAVSDGYEDGAYLILGEQRGPFHHEREP